MTFPIQSTALFLYLKKRDPDGVYSGKVLEVREVLTRWLEYVPQTFPRFTQHTVEHSDEIVIQLSKLLFEGDDPDRPTIKLTSVEAYILIICAYLHDAGMVCSDQEKEKILSSDSWKEWTTTFAADRWMQIQTFRTETAPPEPSVRHFIADMLTRELIAEFIRRMHHKRVVGILRNQSAVGRFAFDDKRLQETIGVICVAHGIARKELEDHVNYPRLRQLRGENVDVRLLAVLLRLGDLLDLRISRACPMLFNAADPLTASSRPHWLQYECIKHMAVSPRAIEIRAECQSIDEHRVLRDWCQWIVDEVREAPGLLAEAGAHRTWQLPRASMGANNDTISITPAVGANYLVRDWRFELDPDSIFQRLIGDLYQNSFIFLRELIQNALDSMRCRMFEELRAQAFDNSEKPTTVSEDVRRRYVLRIEAEQIESRNEMTGQDEMITAIVVDDCGIGMDEDVIQRHFLQVGRSYYDTEQFRRNYTFVPASRFGVGFLSVFAASDYVIVDSLKYPSQQGKGIRLKLTGPRNYLAVADSERRTNGTRIEVRLRPSLNLTRGKLTEMVRTWCRKVEFPIEVSDLGLRTTISRESPEDFLFEVDDAEAAGASFALRTFRIDGRELEGDCYLLAHRSNEGIEDWTKLSWYKYRYRTLYPGAEFREVPGALRCFHGIAVNEHPYYIGNSNAIARIDYRGRRSRPDLSRHDVVTVSGSGEDADEELTARWKEILVEHIDDRESALGTRSWQYRNRLADAFPLGMDYWQEFDGMIPVLVNGKEHDLSLRRLAAVPVVTEVIPAKSQHCFTLRMDVRVIAKTTESAVSASLVDLPAVVRFDDLENFSELFRSKLLEGRSPFNCRWIDATTFAVDWRLDGALPIVGSYANMTFACELSSNERIALYIDHPYPMHDVLLLNGMNPFGLWYLKVAQHFGSTERLRGLNSVLMDAARCCFYYGKGPEPEVLMRHLAGWLAMKDLPEELRPPELKIGTETFHWHYAAA